MGKFDGILFCTDFDGTLAKGTEISEENIKAIKYFQKEGGLFTVATGRYPTYIENFRHLFIPNTYPVWLNGALMCDNTGSPVFESKINTQTALTLIDFIKHNCRDLENVLVYDKNGSKTHYDPSYEPYKIIAVTNTPNGCLEFKKIITKAFGDKFFISRSWPTGLEIINITAGKDICTKKLKELTNSKTLICIGDYENDAEMIKSADIGVAVENALPAVKEAADKITKANYVSAVAEAIYSIPSWL